MNYLDAIHSFVSPKQAIRELKRNGYNAEEFDAPGEIASAKILGDMSDPSHPEIIAESVCGDYSGDDIVAFMGS